MPPPLPLNQLQQQQQRESNLLAQMQSMNMNMNGHQMQQQQQQITKSIAELEQSVIQQAQQRQQIQQQEQMLRQQQQQQRQQQQMQNSGGFGDELGGGIFSSIAKNTPSFGFGASPQPMIQQQPPLQQALFGGSGGSSEGSGLDIFGNPMPKNFNSAFEGLNNHNNNESLGNLFAQQQPLVLDRVQIKTNF
jgi:TolA-binding protein